MRRIAFEEELETRHVLQPFRDLYSIVIMVCGVVQSLPEWYVVWFKERISTILVSRNRWISSLLCESFVPSYGEEGVP